jgi:hypothetical protein
MVKKYNMRYADLQPGDLLVMFKTKLSDWTYGKMVLSVEHKMLHTKIAYMLLWNTIPQPFVNGTPVEDTFSTIYHDSLEEIPLIIIVTRKGARITP